MRIFLTTDVVGGVWRYTVTLVSALVERGHECAVAVVGEAADERLEELPADVEVFQRDLRLEWMEGGVEDVAPTTEWLEEAAGRWTPDVVHLNQFGYATGDFGAPVVVVAHSDVLSWFDQVKGTPAPAEWDRYRDVVRSGLEAADVVVAPTAYQGGLLERHYGRSGVRVIHNGIRPPDDTEPSFDERSMVMVAGRAWDEAKGIAVLEEALEALGEDAPAVHLVGPQSGPDGQPAPVQRLVAHGEVPGAAMERFYGNALLYIAPSLYEPFGLSPLEAAAHGSALLLSGIGSFRELWRDAATFFEPGDPNDLARRLTDVLADEASLEQQARTARARARTLYTRDRMAAAYESLYGEMIGRPLGPGDGTAAGSEAVASGGAAGGPESAGEAA